MCRLIPRGLSTWPDTSPSFDSTHRAAPSERLRYGHPRTGCGICQFRRGPWRRRSPTPACEDLSAARPRTARPLTRSNARTAGSRVAAWSADTPAARPPDQHCGTCRHIPAPAAALLLGWCGSQARLTVSLVSKQFILTDLGRQEIENFDHNRLRLRSAVRYRLCQSSIAHGG